MNNHKSRILATIVAVISTVATAVADGTQIVLVNACDRPDLATSPAQGVYSASQFSYPATFDSCGRIVARPSEMYDCMGHAVETSTDGGASWSSPTTNAATSITFDVEPDVSTRITWLWRKSARCPGIPLTSGTYLCFDRVPGTVPDLNFNSLVFDAACPHTITCIRLLPRGNQTARTDNLHVYGSNDQSTWTLIATNSQKGVKDVYTDIEPFPGVQPYRYYKFDNCVRCNAEELALMTADTVLETDPPRTWEYPKATNSVDRADGVLVHGYLANAPGGLARIEAFVSRTDHGTDIQGWMRDASCIDCGDVASGQTFDASFQNLAPGEWKTRVFAFSDGVATPSQQTFSFRVRTEICIPTAYVLASATTSYPNIAKVYDGIVSTGMPDLNGPTHMYFDMKDIGDRLVSVRIWPRDSSRVPYGSWWRWKTLKLEYTQDQVAWPDAASWKTGARTICSISSAPVASWTEIATDAGTRMDYTPEGSVVPPLVELNLINSPKKPNALRLSGIGRWNAYEIEFRVAPGMGTVFMVQ
jgi:hypothetical protein